MLQTDAELQMQVKDPSVICLQLIKGFIQQMMAKYHWHMSYQIFKISADI